MPLSHILPTLREQDDLIPEFKCLLEAKDNDGIWYIDSTNPNKVLTNDKFWITLLQADQNKIIDLEEFDALVYEVDLPRKKLYVENLWSGKFEKSDLALRFKTKDNQLIWIRCRAFGIKNKMGEVDRIIGIHTNLSAELNMDASNEFNRKLFQDFFMLNQNFLCIGHVSGEFLKVNFSFLQNLGYKEEELIGTTYEDVVHKEDWSSTRKALLNAYHGESVVSFKNRIRTLTGEYRIVEWKAVARGSLLYGSGTDISDKELQRLKIIEEQQTLKDITDNVPGAIVRFISDNNDGFKVLFASYRFKELFNIDPETINRELLLGLVVPEDFNHVMNTFTQARDTRTQWNDEFRININGEIKWVNGSGTFKLLETGERLWHLILFDNTYKKKQEAKLMRARRMLEQTNEVAKVGGWEYDLLAGKLYWSSYTKRIHKLPDDFIPSSDAAFSFYKEGSNRERIQYLLGELIKNGTTFSEELQIVDTTGKDVWVLVTGYSESFEGKTTKIFGSFQDISDRKKSEQLLIESENRFKMIVENANDIIFTLTPDLKFTYISPNVNQYLGYGKEAILGESFNKAVHREDFQLCVNYVQHVFNGITPKDPVYYRIMRWDGQWKWLAAKGTSIDINGENHFLGIARDVTQEKNTEESLKASEQNAIQLAQSYKTLIDSQNVFVAKTDAFGNYIYCNAYFLRFFGLDSRIIGVNAMDTIHPDDHQKTRDTVAKCMEHPNTPFPLIIRKPTSLGEFKGSKWEFQGIPDESGKVCEINCIGYDISEQLNSLERAQELLKITSDQNFKLKSFSHIVSHNIRSHSANLVSLADFISDTTNEEEKATFISMLKISTSKLEETIRNLSEIINVEESTDKSKIDVDLFFEANKTIQSLNAAFFQHKIDVNNNIHPSTKVHVVPTYLESILLNLVSNAVRYRSEKRIAHIELNSYKITNYTVLEVKDNGVGIDLQKHGHKLFGMYKTFHGNEDARGFGLYLVKTQIEAMGGKIDVDSSLDVGTTFRVYFRDKTD